MDPTLIAETGNSFDAENFALSPLQLAAIVSALFIGTVGMCWLLATTL